MTTAAILLAAGASRRMGEPKPLLPWGNGTLLEWELAELKRSQVDDIVVVLGADAETVRRSLGEDARLVVFNQRWPHGRAGSLAKGARSLLMDPAINPDAVLIMNVDQPTRADIIDRLLDALRRGGAEAVQPSYQGKAGHPVVVRSSLLPELARVSEATLGLRGVLDAHPALLVEMDDEPVVRLDLDTPDTLEEARRLLAVSR
ncbi:MAG: nucleotidyltransferase family protein [Dehalococcoidia bacterium]